MGHLVNPVGFRVGYFSNWADLWSTSNNLVYAELLHNTLSYRKVMGFFFENFITDRHSILYSHFTVESAGFANLRLKMYFYDGIVEQKMAHLVKQLQRFKWRKTKAHNRMLRRFRKIKSIRRLRISFLRLWRYYDYLLVRQIVFFFIYFLNLGRRNMTRLSQISVLKYFYKVLAVEWFKALDRDPSISVFAFVKYYLKLLVVKGFDSASSTSDRLHFKGLHSNFSVFLKALDDALYSWRKRQNFFSLALFKKKIFLKRRYKKFVKIFNKVNRFCSQFFTAFYRLYLLNFRQSKFFRFMLFILNPIFSSLGFLNTKVEFFGIDNNSVAAMFLARYIARKVEMRFQIRELFTPIGKEMKFLIKHTPSVLGYKLQFVGRLTRRGKVRTTWRLGGSIPTSKMEAQIEHAFYLGILRNGICCVRVWLYRHKSFGNYNYNYVYRVKT